MKAIVFLFLAVAALLLFNGCVSEEKNATDIVKELPEAKAFLAEHPNAEIRAIYLSKEDTATQITGIREQCGSQMKEQSYWFVEIKEGDARIRVWLDGETKNALCIIKKGETVPLDECSSNAQCNDQNQCTIDRCSGTPKKCSNAKITECRKGDDCCPSGCTYSRDSDCPKEDECETNSDCPDADLCTVDNCSGTPKKCSHSRITNCVNNDNCCPSGCSSKNDNDCPVVLKACSDLGGFICSAEAKCSGFWLNAKDSDKCCSADCIECGCQDLTFDGKVNSVDLAYVGLKYGTNDPLADIDMDANVTDRDLNCISLSFGQETSCSGPKKLEYYACAEADITADGKVDIFDLALIGKTIRSKQGETNYDARADITKDNWVNNIDFAIMRSHYGESCHKAETNGCGCADVTFDAKVDAFDLAYVGQKFGTNDALADIDMDTNVTKLDLNCISVFLGQQTNCAGAKAVEEYSCEEADIVQDGKIDVFDLALIGKTIKSKQGQSDFNADADITKDGWVNNIDFAIMRSRYGESCYKAETKECGCPDVTFDAKVDVFDLAAVGQKHGTNDPLTDIDMDGNVSDHDLNCVNAAYNQQTNCAGTKALEQYSCAEADIKRDGKVNIFDLALIGKTIKSKQGETNFDLNADITKDGWVNNIDFAIVNSRYGETC